MDVGVCPDGVAMMPWGAIRWIGQKVFGLWITDCSFNPWPLTFKELFQKACTVCTCMEKCIFFQPFSYILKYRDHLYLHFEVYVFSTVNIRNLVNMSAHYGVLWWAFHCYCVPTVLEDQGIDQGSSQSRSLFILSYFFIFFAVVVCSTFLKVKIQSNKYFCSLTYFIKVLKSPWVRIHKYHKYK